MDLVVDNGKVTEPSNIKKVIAAVTRDTDAVIVLPFGDVHQFVVDSIWNGTPWLSKYKSASMEYNKTDNSFTLRFHTYSDKDNNE